MLVLLFFTPPTYSTGNKATMEMYLYCFSVDIFFLVADEKECIRSTQQKLSEFDIKIDTDKFGTFLIRAPY